MANLSDGEDSQMHDSPSSTPSTPPALSGQNPLINPAEHLSLHSPPDTQQTPPASQQGTPLVKGEEAVRGGGGGVGGGGGGGGGIGVGVGVGGSGGSGGGGGGAGGGPAGGNAVGGGPGPGGFVPSWASKRAVEDAETAREKLVDGKFTLRWVGDDYDESDMFKTN